MSELVLTDEMKINAAKNEWGKSFTLGGFEDNTGAIVPEQTFNIKDLGYFDYIDFVGLVKPLVTVAANGLEMANRDGELAVDFKPENLDFDAIFKLCGKELPRMAGIVCRQSKPKITDQEVAMLARRPQRLVEIVLLQVLHNNMIQEFAGFFQRLTAMVTNLVPDIAKVSAPIEIGTESMTEEIPS